MSNRLASLAVSTSVLKALPGKLDIKSGHVVFAIYLFVYVLYVLIIFLVRL